MEQSITRIMVRMAWAVADTNQPNQHYVDSNGGGWYEQPAAHDEIMSTVADLQEITHVAGAALQASLSQQRPGMRWVETSQHSSTKGIDAFKL